MFTFQGDGVSLFKISKWKLAENYEKTNNRPQRTIYTRKFKTEYYNPIQKQDRKLQEKLLDSCSL